MTCTLLLKYNQTQKSTTYHTYKTFFQRRLRSSTIKKLDEEAVYYYEARYLDPRTSRWLGVDPAMGEYVPSAPINEEAKKRNGNLPGMGGVFNYVNFHVYHYAGNNPVKYTDPNGMWIDNEDGTFTAEKGDTLYGLQQETGRDWTSSNYKEDPRKLQIGQTVSFAAENENNNNRTIDSTRDATNHYRTGNGNPVNIGPNTIAALRTHPDQLMRQNRITSGNTTNPFEGNYNIDMTANAFFIGQTRVEYRATYGSKFVVIDFTAFVNDGFWDATDVLNIFTGDGLGPRHELPFHTPYSFIPHRWTISAPTPR